MPSLGREHPLRLFTKRLPRTKGANFNFCLAPSERLRDFAYAQFFAFLEHHHHSILGLERVEQAMRQVVGLAPLFGLANQLLGRRTIHQLHPLYFGCAEVADQFLRTAPPAAQLVITKIHDDRSQPSPKRHLSPIASERRERADKTLLRDIPRHLLVGEKPPAQTLDALAMSPRKLAERISLPGKDFRYQFLVGFVRQSPPCPSSRRQTQHNCSLIRIIQLTVTRFLGQILHLRFRRVTLTGWRRSEAGARKISGRIEIEIDSGI